MKLLHIAAVSALAPALSGCFFVYIPGPVMDSMRDTVSGEHGNYCVTANTKIGDRLRLPNGGFGTVQSLNGTSHRCKEAARPIRADVT